MALHQKNLWIVTSRANSSLDVLDALGGMTAGCIAIPFNVLNGVKGLRVFTTNNPTVPEDYGNFQALVTGLGGRSVSAAGNGSAIIEFNTTNSTSGTRGVYRVDGLFEREFHYHEALTKGEAMRFIAPHGIDEYNWAGAESVAASASKNLLTLGDFTEEVREGGVIIQANSMVVLPSTDRTRGVIITLVIDGTYEGSGAHDFNLELRSSDGTKVLQGSALWGLTTKVEKASATFALYTSSNHHELSTTGFQPVLTNTSQNSVSLTGVKIIAQTISNPDFTVG